ncbi:benzoate membrane transport protein [Neobacillus sp. B4I6]|uniref:benzoate/H(+) symporter BenE family transporter n=1 Tax=Neobacillus sp. B4I6 TaxID=3373925 RepID=UPI003D226D8B
MKQNRIAEGIKDIPKHLNVNTISARTLAAIFGCTGPALIIVGGAANGGLTQVQAISWLFAVYFFGGLLGLILALKYKQPIAGAYSIPGAVLVAGIIVFILGITGIIGKVIHWIPVPIVMAMIVGAMIRFGTGRITSIEQAPIIAGSVILVYLLSSRFIKKFPPILTSFAVAVILAAVMGQFQGSDMEAGFITPQLVTPSFNIDAIISIGLPLAILVIGAENAQATCVLITQGYKPHVNAMPILSGIGGVITSFFGGHNANIEGSMTAICSSKEAGEKQGRYVAVVVNSLLFSSFGLFAGIIITFVVAMPSVLIGTVAGLAMIGVLLSSLQEAFSKQKFQIGSFFALVIAMSGVSFYGINSTFWAIVGGVMVSLIIENDDFNVSRKHQIEETLESEFTA